MPLGQVAVELFVVAAEAAVNGSQTLQSGVVDTFQSADPQFQVGIYRVLHQYRNVHAFQGIGYFLYGKGIGGGAGTHPEYVYSGFQTFIYVFGSGHFGGYVHACFLFHFFEPGQAFYADAFEAARFGAGFPDSCAEYLHSFGRQLLGCVHYLFFCLGTAWAGND